MKSLVKTAICAGLGVAACGAQVPKLSDADRALAHDIFKQLIEINTTDSVGDVGKAAEAMRERLLAAGFEPKDAQLLGPNDRKRNLVVRLHGRPGKKPVLLIGHLDVVEAKHEDWTTDPFVFTEKDGFFYGRGTQDMKDSDAALVMAFLRMKREGFVPDRDLILALTADEEGGQSNGVDWLIKNHRDLVSAAFALNPDSGGIELDGGKPKILAVEATEKLYADFHITATNPGGHSSLPRPDNAIYELAHALTKLEATPFPVELNEVTRAQFAALEHLDPAHMAEMQGVLATPPDQDLAARLSANPIYNSTLRTTCVATMLSGGHAPNALPARAQANVNCRILPGHSAEEVRQDLIKLFADDKLTVEYVTDAGEVLGKGPERKSAAPPPLNPEVFQPLEATAKRMFPGATILPIMEPGASDSIYTTAAGMPSYGFSGMGIERGGERMHGRDERLGVESFYTGVEFEYQYLKALASE